jgi:hypothetical protein
MIAMNCWAGQPTVNRVTADHGYCHPSTLVRYVFIEAMGYIRKNCGLPREDQAFFSLPCAKQKAIESCTMKNNREKNADLVKLSLFL